MSLHIFHYALWSEKAWGNEYLARVDFDQEFVLPIPADRTMLKRHHSTAIRPARFIHSQVTELAALRTEAAPSLSDRPSQVMRTSLRRVVDRPILIIAVSSAPVRCGLFFSSGASQPLTAINLRTIFLFYRR